MTVDLRAGPFENGGFVICLTMAGVVLARKKRLT